MKEVKVIDLINKIANDEVVPDYGYYIDRTDKSMKIILICEDSLFYKLLHRDILLTDSIKFHLEDTYKETEERIEEAINYIKSFPSYIPEDNKEDLLAILESEVD